MRIVLLLALALVLAACGESALTGTVEAVRETEPREAPELPHAYDHPLVPEVAWEIVVRLEDGTAVVVLYSGTQRYEPGDPVRLLRAEDGALLL
jgi:hypothetical protein